VGELWSALALPHGMPQLNEVLGLLTQGTWQQVSNTFLPLSGDTHMHASHNMHVPLFGNISHLPSSHLLITLKVDNFNNLPALTVRHWYVRMCSTYVRSACTNGLFFRSLAVCGQLIQV
jgi:hypothetical protein